MRGGVAHGVQPDGGSPGLGRRGVDGTDRDVVHAGGRVDLLGGVRGAADQPVVAHDRSRLVDRQVVLAEMHAVGAGGDR